MSLVAESDLQAPRGLERLAVARTELSDVDGDQGFYHYRGYDAVRLAAGATVEEVWHLLHEGSLPDPEQREVFAARTRAARVIPDALRQALPAIAAASPPGLMEALRTGMSVAGQALGCRSWLDQEEADTREQALRLSALLPVVTAALWRLAHGEDVVEPHPDLGYAANYLYMIEGAEPESSRIRGLERYLVLTIDHGFCNSTFAARVIASSGADMGAAVVGAIGAFSGPLHGGAVGKVPSMLDDIARTQDVEGSIRDALDRGERLMGFGHPVYRAPDPRTPLLRESAERAGGERVALAERVEAAAVALLNERRPERRREANVDFYAGVVLEQAGVPEGLFTCTFAVARVIGWTAHVLEQIADNRIFRPAANYVGPPYPREL